MSLTKVSGLMDYLKAKALRNYLMAQCLMACGKKACLKVLAIASIQMKVVMMVTGKMVNHMGWARKSCLMALLLMVGGLRARQEDTVLRYCRTGQSSKDNGRSLAFFPGSVSFLTARSTTDNGMRASLKDSELRFGLMDAAMRVTGSKASRSERASKLTKTAQPNEVDGKAVSSSF